MINIIIFLKHFEGLSTGGRRIENELESFELELNLLNFPTR